MRLSFSILTSAALQTAFVACAVLGSWQIETLNALDYVDDAPRQVALYIPPPVITLAPVPTIEPASSEPLATTIEEQRKPQTPPARVVKEKPQTTPPKQVAKPTPKKKTPEPPRKTPELKVLVAAADTKDAPVTPATLAENQAPAVLVERAALPSSSSTAPAVNVASTSHHANPVIQAPVGQHSDVDRAGALKTYKRLLFSTIDKKKSVPRAARRARLEGTVYLSVTLDHTGEILSVKVRKSSGHATLDEGAVSTMRAIKRLPAPPEALGWTKKTLTIPIRYKIK